jgi:hypothetical protein
MGRSSSQGEKTMGMVIDGRLNVEPHPHNFTLQIPGDGGWVRECGTEAQLLGRKLLNRKVTVECAGKYNTGR